jgi:hypothetical protein
MIGVVEPTYRSPDSDLASQVAKLWPHRECEANIISGQFCRIGLHWCRSFTVTIQLRTLCTQGCCSFHQAKLLSTKMLCQRQQPFSTPLVRYCS